MAIKLCDLSYKGILKNINMSLDLSNIYGIIGESGSGKSTLLNIIFKDIIPTNGTIKITENVNNISYLRQYPEYNFFHKSVKKEIEYYTQGHHFKNVEKRIIDSLIMVGLDESYLDLDPFKLSSSQRRKVALACVLVSNPKVLLLDEPFAGLNNVDKNEIIRLLKRLKNRYNKTIIICTHDTDFLHKLVDYVYVLHKGEIVLQGDKYQVFKRDLKKYGVISPKEVEFSNIVLNQKGIKIGYRDDINDLIKDIYRFVK